MNRTKQYNLNDSYRNKRIDWTISIYENLNNIKDKKNLKIN